MRHPNERSWWMQTDHSLSDRNFGSEFRSPVVTPTVAGSNKLLSSDTSSTRIRPSSLDKSGGSMAHQNRSDPDQRTILMSTFNKKSAAAEKTSISSSRHVSQINDDLEAQNDELLNEMHGKVLGLKEIALGMKQQVQESNTLLDTMGSAMSAAGGLLGTTMTRMRALSSHSSGRHIWILMLFFVGLLFVLYLLARGR